MRIERNKDGEEIVVTWALNPRGTELLAWGSSSQIFYWPDRPTEVMKLPTTKPSSIEDIEIEKLIYKRLGHHPNIVSCLRIAETGPVSVCAEHIVLKRAEHGSIRQYFLDGGTATTAERIKWCQDIANAVHYLHEHSVRHGDLGGRNVLLDSSRTVLLCDFAGSGLDGKPPRVRAEEGFKHPILEENRNGTMRSELHALGSTIYELLTSQRPHHQLQDWKVQWIRELNCPGVKDDHVESWMVQNWLTNGIYPDVSDVELGDVISECWKGSYNSADEVARDIQKMISSLNPYSDQTI